MQSKGSIDSHTKWLNNINTGTGEAPMSFRTAFTAHTPNTGKVGGSGIGIAGSSGSPESGRDDLSTFHLEEERNSFNHSLFSDFPGSRDESPKEMDVNFSIVSLPERTMDKNVPAPAVTSGRGSVGNTNATIPFSIVGPSVSSGEGAHDTPQLTAPSTAVEVNKRGQSGREYKSSYAPMGVATPVTPKERQDYKRFPASTAPASTQQEETSLSSYRFATEKPPTAVVAVGPAPSDAVSPMLPPHLSAVTGAPQQTSFSNESTSESELRPFSKTLGPIRTGDPSYINTDIEPANSNTALLSWIPVSSPPLTREALAKPNAPKEEKTKPTSGSFPGTETPVPLIPLPLSPAAEVEVATTLSLLDVVPEDERSAQYSSRLLQKLSCMKGYSLSTVSSGPPTSRRLEGEDDERGRTAAPHRGEHDVRQKQGGGTAGDGRARRHGRLAEKNCGGAGGKRDLYEEAKLWRLRKARWMAMERNRKECLTEEAEDAECCFQPKLSPYAATLVRPAALRPENRAQYEMLQHRMWEAVKKQERIAEELKECTFRPLTFEAIRSIRRQAAQKIKAITENGEGEGKGPAEEEGYPSASPQSPAASSSVFHKLFEDAQQRTHFQQRIIKSAAKQVQEVIAKGESGGVSSAPEMTPKDIQQVVERLFSRSCVGTAGKMVLLSQSSHTPKLSKKTREIMAKKVERGERAVDPTKHLYPYSHRTPEDRQDLNDQDGEGVLLLEEEKEEPVLAIKEKEEGEDEENVDETEIGEPAQTNSLSKEVRRAVKNQMKKDVEIKKGAGGGKSTPGVASMQKERKLVYPLDVVRENLQDESVAMEKETAAERRRRQERSICRLYKERMKNILSEKYSVLAKHILREQHGLVGSLATAPSSLPISSLAKAAALLLPSTESPLLLPVLQQCPLSSLTQAQFVHLVLDSVLKEAAPPSTPSCAPSPSGRIETEKPKDEGEEKEEEDDDDDEREEKEEKQPEGALVVVTQEGEEEKKTTKGLSSSVLLQLSSSHFLLQPLPPPTTTAATVGTAVEKAVIAAGRTPVHSTSLPKVRRKPVDAAVLEAARLKRESFLQTLVLEAERRKYGGYIPGEEEPPTSFRSRPIPRACRANTTTEAPCIKKTRAAVLREQFVAKQQEERALAEMQPVLAPAMHPSMMCALLPTAARAEDRAFDEEPEGENGDAVEVLVDEDGNECIIGGVGEHQENIEEELDSSSPPTPREVEREEHTPTVFVHGMTPVARPTTVDEMLAIQDHWKERWDHTSHTPVGQEVHLPLNSFKVSQALKKRNVAPHTPSCFSSYSGIPVVVITEEDFEKRNAARRAAQARKNPEKNNNRSQEDAQYPYNRKGTSSKRNDHPAYMGGKGGGSDGYATSVPRGTTSGVEGVHGPHADEQKDDEYRESSPLPCAVEHAIPREAAAVQRQEVVLNTWNVGHSERRQDGGPAGCYGGIEAEEDLPLSLQQQRQPELFSTPSAQIIPPRTTKKRIEASFLHSRSTLGKDGRIEFKDCNLFHDAARKEVREGKKGGKDLDGVPIEGALPSSPLSTPRDAVLKELNEVTLHSHSMEMSEVKGSGAGVPQESLMDIPYALRHPSSMISPVPMADPLPPSSSFASALRLHSVTSDSSASVKNKRLSNSFISSSSVQNKSKGAKSNRSGSHSLRRFDPYQDPAKQATSLIQQVVSSEVGGEGQELLQFGKDLLIQQLREYQRKRH